MANINEEAEYISFEIANVLNDINQGKITESKACATKCWSVPRFRKIVRYLQQEYLNGKTNFYNIEKTFKPSWEEKLMRDLTGRDDYVVITDIETILVCLHSDYNCISEKELYILLRYYRDGDTFENIGKEYGVSKERIRQVISRALRRLRRPFSYRYLMYGEDYILLSEDYEKRKAAYEERLEGMNSLENKIKMLEEQMVNIEPKTLTLREMPIGVLDLSVRSYNGLARSGITNLEELTSYSSKRLLRLRNIGETSLSEIVKALKKYNLYLKGDEE